MSIRVSVKFAKISIHYVMLRDIYSEWAMRIFQEN